MFEFFNVKLGIDAKKIIVCGRSIGSGPAVHLAAKYNPRCMFLISPIKSVVSIARKLCGNLANILMDERFDNVKVANKVKCPVALFHGIEDNMVSYMDSISLLMEGFTHAKAHLFLRQEMTHNKFDYDNDLIKPIKYFLKCHNIVIYDNKKAKPNINCDDAFS